MEKSLNYSLEIEKVVAWCNDFFNTILFFVNLPTVKTLDITDENNTTDAFSSNLISNFDIDATDNIVSVYNNVVEMSIVD